MRLTASALPIAALFASIAGIPVAHATAPEDISISGLMTYGGVALDQDAATGQFDALALELGSAIANKPWAPARTLGTAGFDLSFGTTFVLIDTNDDEDGTPSPWAAGHNAEDPANMLIMPTLSMRKGLPLSFEMGARASWLAGSRQGVISGFLRAAPVEGYKPWPDLTFQIGYSGYVGNDELELGVLDIGGSVGGTFAFGSLPGIRQAQVSPYIGGGVLVVHAAAVLDDDTSAAMFGPPAGDDDPSQRSYPVVPQVAAGIQVTNSTVLFRLAGTWTPSTAPSIHVGMGFAY
ncbi:MAG: hypothetical protein ACI9MC_001577 [Kiritimatiellia bacterium]|jgi:hypothetical protein